MQAPIDATEKDGARREGTRPRTSLVAPRAARPDFWARLLGAALLLALGGCGKPLVYAEVEGKVTQNGKPVPGVHVWFYPEADGTEQPPYATGVTDAQGAYTLTAATGKRGALVGKNRVVVNRPPRGRSDDAANPAPPGPPIPVAYTQVMDTPLIVEVAPGPKQTINVNLPKW